MRWCANEHFWHTYINYSLILYITAHIVYIKYTMWKASREHRQVWLNVQQGAALQPSCYCVDLRFPRQPFGTRWQSCTRQLLQGIYVKLLRFWSKINAIQTRETSTGATRRLFIGRQQRVRRFRSTMWHTCLIFLFLFFCVCFGSGVGQKVVVFLFLFNLKSDMMTSMEIYSY